MRLEAGSCQVTVLALPASLFIGHFRTVGFSSVSSLQPPPRA